MPTDIEQKQETREQIHHNASLTFPYMLMNTLATIIACYGLLADSTAVVIGAMVIAMLLGPIIGIALGLVDGDTQLLRKAFLAEIIGAATVLTIAFAIGKLHSEIPLGKEIMARTAPNIIDLIIALAGGAAGAYAIASPRISAGLVGVAIATALVPPLSTCSLLLARGENALAFGAFLLFFANFVAIQFSSSMVLWFLGYHQITRLRTQPKQSDIVVFMRNAGSAILLIALTVILGINFTNSLSRQVFETKIRQVVTANLIAFADAQLVEIVTVVEEPVLDLRVTVRTSHQPTHEEIVNLQKAIATELQRPILLKLIDIPIVKLDPLIPPTQTLTAPPSSSAISLPTQTITLTLTNTPSPLPTLTATPTPTATPVSAVVANTKGVGVVLRDAPNGKIIGSLPENAPVQILYRHETINRVEWVEIRDVLDRVGWVPARLLEIK